MTLEGETIMTGAPNFCEGDPDIPHERLVLKFEVLSSAAGFYVGTQCPYCGPFSRESIYFPDRATAERILNDHVWRQ